MAVRHIQFLREVLEVNEQYYGGDEIAVKRRQDPFAIKAMHSRMFLESSHAEMIEFLLQCNYKSQTLIESMLVAYL